MDSDRCKGKPLQNNSRNFIQPRSNLSNLKSWNLLRNRHLFEGRDTRAAKKNVRRFPKTSKLQAEFRGIHCELKEQATAHCLAPCPVADGVAKIPPLGEGSEGEAADSRRVSASSEPGTRSVEKKGLVQKQGGRGERAGGVERGDKEAEERRSRVSEGARVRSLRCWMGWTYDGRRKNPSKVGASLSVPRHVRLSVPRFTVSHPRPFSTPHSFCFSTAASYPHQLPQITHATELARFRDARAIGNL